MALYNASPAFNGVGGLFIVITQRLAISPILSGAGLLDSWRVTHRYDYDPANPRGDNMRLRKATIAQEGFFGDD